jgi:hypothetical protein
VRFEFAVKYNNETLGGEKLVVVRDQDGTWRIGNYARRAGPYQAIPGDPPGTDVPLGSTNMPPAATGTPGTRY